MLLTGNRMAIAALLTLTAIPFIVGLELPFPFPFVTSKAYLFRALIGIALVGWALAAVWGKPLDRPTPLACCFGALLLFSAVSNLHSPDPWRAFLGDWMRMEGFMLLIHLALAFWLLRSLLDTDRLQRQFLGALALGSIPVAALGIFQYSLFLRANAPQSGIWSSFGNSSYYGQYIVLLAFLCFLLAVQPGRWRRLWIGIAMLNLLMLPFTQSRGALLGFAAGFALILFLHGSPRLRMAALATPGFLLALGMLAPSLLEPVPILRRLVVEGPLWSDIRLPAWHAAIDAIAERPWLGWGQEGFRTAHDAYCQINCGYFDRAHNWFLERLVTGGVPGLLLWCALVGWGIRQICARWAGWERSWALAFVAAYFGSSLTLFDTLTSYLLLVSVFAFADRKPLNR